MGRTMSEELERAARAFTKCYPALVGKDELRNALDGAFAELDAERAHSAKLAERVAELEREQDQLMSDGESHACHDGKVRPWPTVVCSNCGPAERDRTKVALAASQAENVRLREALEYFKGADEADVALATPAPVDALREVCEKVAAKAWDYGFIERGALEVAGAPALTQESHAAKRAADVGPIVSSILGPEVKP